MRNVVRRTAATIVGAGLCWAAATAAAQSQYFRRPVSHLDPTIMRIDEMAVLGANVDGSTGLIDHDGRPFRWSDLLGKPLILVPSYYTCDGSCSLLNAALLNLLGDVKRVRPGEDFRILTISFDRRDTRETTRAFRQHLDLVGELAGAWSFATFEKQDELERETSRIGFKFFWSPEDQIFLHPGAFLFLSPEGRLIRVLYHQDIEGRDVELAILDARQGQFRLREVANFALSLCYSYNYQDGKYKLSLPLFIGVGSLLIGSATLAGSVAVYKRNRRRKPVEDGTHAQVA